MIAEFRAALLPGQIRSVDRAVRHNPAMLERSIATARQAA